MQGNTIPNGEYGNGFDDDCDGLVDEGCPCPPGVAPGGTKDCYLMPSSWTDNSTNLPVGWCAENSKGTVVCERRAGGSMIGGSRLEWKGECRGARKPQEEVCAAGDLNCDGVEMNVPGRDCSCELDPVECPKEAVKMSPFPDPANLPAINGLDWVRPEFKSRAKDWQWELTGGDCDNILHFPTFALFGSSSSSSPMLGSVVGGLGAAHNQKGVKIDQNAPSKVHPAFSLSGDYILLAKLVVNDTPYECSVKVQVRAPGIRAELCWHDTGKVDNDLHVARMQASTGNCQRHGWHEVCKPEKTGDDVYTGNKTPDWGYVNSSNDACFGWGSQNSRTYCANPRLDRDNLGCNTEQRDPNAKGNYCGPENVNLDNPRPGDSFLVSVHAYNDRQGGASYPHVNIYCDGERKLSVGYIPGQNDFPKLADKGDLWTAAHVKWNGLVTDPCKVSGIPSRTPNQGKDGSNEYCVDNVADTKWLFRRDGGYVGNPAEACWH